MAIRGRVLPAAGAAATLAILVVTIAPASARTNTPPQSMSTCRGGRVTAACEAAALKDFDRARAKEHLAPMVLPARFAKLSPAAQLFVLANIDRVDRGHAAIPALNRRLDTIATSGARRGTDPSFPPGNYAGGANYADVVGSSLYSEYEWVYDDGKGSHNVDCTSQQPSGCWGHRRNILASYPSPARMGAGRSGSSLAEIFMGPAPKRYRAQALTWKSIVKRFPVGVSAHSLAKPGTLRVFASGLSMSVTASTTGSWTVSKKRFHLGAGHATTLRLSGSGSGALRLKGPNGTVTVRLG